MDARSALLPGTVLRLHTCTGYTEYVVRREIGRGATCIVYDASTTDNLGNDKLVRIKECYPHALRMVRREDGSLVADARDHAAFEVAKGHILEAYRKNHRLFATPELTNTIANTTNLYEENGTIYMVCTWLNGQTLADAKIETLHDCIALVLSTARVIKNIHDAGYLYLDLKPENVLTIRGSLDLIQLFDFNSMIALEDLKAALRDPDSAALRTTYTRGYAPLEQQTGNLRQIGRHSDLYSLGALLFDMLWHRIPTAFDCEENAAFDYQAMAYPYANYQDALFRELTVFFHKTLANYHADRYQDASQAIEQLKTLLALSDASKPYLFSSFIPKPVFFTGRKEELQALSALLHRPGQHVFNVFGMGGIGKSTLARAWYHAHRDEYDAVLWLYAQGNAQSLLCDDRTVHVNTVRRTKDETQEEYFERKQRVLSEIARKQHILVVVDNVQREQMQDLQPLSELDWDVLLISRAAIAEGLYPSLCVQELELDALADLFVRYAHIPIRSEKEVRDFETIAGAVYGHTLSVELLGRQIAASYLTLHEAAEMVKRSGFRALPRETVDYVHDRRASAVPLTEILDELVEIDRFTETEKQILQILEGFDRPGIRVDLLRELTSCEMIERIRRLEACGWLAVENHRIVFHPLLHEYIRTWPRTQAGRDTLDRMLVGLHAKINPNQAQPDLDKQFPADYGALYELLWVADQLLAYAQPASPASQLLRFRMLMEAPVDMDEAVLHRMLFLLGEADDLDARCVLRLYETSAFLLGRLEHDHQAHQVLKGMKAYLKKHPSHYYTSWYHRAKAVLLNNRYGHEKDEVCLKHENIAIKEALASSHPDAHRQLAGALLTKTQTLLEMRSKMQLCGEMIMQADSLLSGEPACDYERYHCDCVSAMYYAVIGDEESALAHMHSATRHADITKDSPLAFAEHLLDETAAVYVQLGHLADAAETVKRAIAICDEHEDMKRYRAVRADAYLFLGKIYKMYEE